MVLTDYSFGLNDFLEQVETPIKSVAVDGIG
jgi:hypothetical protein